MADCSTFDTLVVDWLHDELDPAEAARVTRHIDGCAACWQTAEALVRVRALIRALPEEEPPAAISARVMREAAAHAATRQRRGLGALVPAWMTGVLGRAWAHPAAAAVASLVLVAGVAGALLARDRLELATPRLDSAVVHRDDVRGEVGQVDDVASGSASSAAMTSPAAEAVHPSEMAMAERDHEMDGRGRPSGTRAQLGDDKRAAERARRRPPAMPAQRAEREAREAGRDLAARAGDAEEQAALLAEDAADEGGLDLAGNRGGEGRRGSGGGKEAFVQAPEPAAPSQELVAEPAGLEARGYAQPSATPRRADAKPRTETWAESRHAELRAALNDQQCLRAVGIADDIQAREPGYYRSKLARSKDLEACRSSNRKAANRAGKARDRVTKPGTADAPKAGGSSNAE